MRPSPLRVEDAGTRGHGDTGKETRRPRLRVSASPRRRVGYSTAMIVLLIAGGLFAGGCAAKNPKTKTSAEVLLNERMAAVLLRDGRFSDAENAYRDVLKSDPRNPELYDGLGVALLAQGKVKESQDSEIGRASCRERV